MKTIATLLAFLGSMSCAMAHHPIAGRDIKRCEPFDCIEKLEPKNYRERYNRPCYLFGKIAHCIAPSSQEAMSWHEHVHRGTYLRHEGPVFKRYYYPKPWEVLGAGPKKSVPQPGESGDSVLSETVVSQRVVSEKVISEQVISDKPVKVSAIPLPNPRKEF